MNRTFFGFASLLATFAAPVLLTTGCEPESAEQAAFADDTGFDTGSVDEQGKSSFDGLKLYTDPVSNAATQATRWKTSDPTGAALMLKMAAQPQAVWIGDWVSNPTTTVDKAVTAGGTKLRTFVVYNIPNRDCGNFSAGGAADKATYASFISKIAAGLNHRKAIIVLEPDALAAVSCLSSTKLLEREQMLAAAVTTLTAAGGKVYIDAGDSNWVSESTMAYRLGKANVAGAAGFALNVSHTEYTSDEIGYANDLRARLGTNAHYVIDTSRNGVGPSDDNEWCNPQGVAIGAKPTTTTTDSGLDAKLWIKPPGNSDGYCHGGPEAGDWWSSYARDLAETAEDVGTL